MTEKQRWAMNEVLRQINKFTKSKDIEPGWRFSWNRRRRSYGRCIFEPKLIELSVYFVNAAEEAQILDVILHEVAHAIAGPNAHHGPKWKAVCRRIGAAPKTYSKTVAGIPSQFRGKCPICNSIYNAHRTLKNMDKRLCAKRMCSARARKKYIIWEKQTEYGTRTI